MPCELSERAFDRGFVAYQRGDHLGALLFFEEAYLIDPAHEEALLNYSRVLRVLGAASPVRNHLVRDGGGQPQHQASNGHRPSGAET